MDLIRLREQTAGEHAQTEDTVPLMSPTLTRAEYVENLRSFYRVVGAWDRWVDAHAPQDLLPLLAGRRRSTLLQHDLEAMGARVPDDDVLADFAMEESAVSGDSRSVFLGRMYVMEGSTLGGQYIARHVEETLSLVSGQGNSYFRGYGEATGDRWREFRAVLQTLPETEAETVIASAKEMFSIFRETMQEPASGSTNAVSQDSFVHNATDR
jgi:heme oxygenase